MCTNCPPGSVSGIASSHCTTCPPGSYQSYSNLGIPACFPCGSGMSSEGGTSSCFNCPPGTFSREGSTCTVVPAGVFSNFSNTFWFIFWLIFFMGHRSGSYNSYFGNGVYGISTCFYSLAPGAFMCLEGKTCTLLFPYNTKFQLSC